MQSPHEDTANLGLYTKTWRQQNSVSMQLDLCTRAWNASHHLHNPKFLQSCHMDDNFSLGVVPALSPGGQLKPLGPCVYVLLPGPEFYNLCTPSSKHLHSWAAASSSRKP